MKPVDTPAAPPTSESLFRLVAAASEPAGKGVAALSQSQERMLDAMDEFVAGWLVRRRAGARAASHAALSICAARTPVALFNAQQEWAAGMLERLVADSVAAQKEWTGICSALFPTMTPAGSDSQTHEETPPSPGAKRGQAA